MNEGPTKVVVNPKYTCSGCLFLELKNWKFYGENDDTDSGTDAKCIKVNKHISSYWYSNDTAPKWCPYLLGDP